MEIKAIEPSKIMSVYSGQDGKCCCGCKGKHSYAPAHVDAASKNRGYAVTMDEVNAATVSRVVNKINANLAIAEAEYNYTAVVIGKRIYIAYALPEVAS